VRQPEGKRRKPKSAVHPESIPDWSPHPRIRFR
jgi:hypothetical protein